ncbi:MAG: hypothetical protein WC741_03260 [Patescibacteria group bacterium]|jgi:hypothetical protein
MKKKVVIVSLSIFIGLLNVSKVIIGSFQTSKDDIYLAIGHYLFDYFIYIQQIVQGIRGHWLVDNPFSPNDQAKTFIAYGQYLLLGKFAKIFHWSPYFSYWFSIFILSVILSLLIFYLIKRLLPNENFFLQISAWFLSLFATPFVKLTIINNHFNIIPYYRWYAPMSMFDRFGNLPHHLSASILVILILLLMDKVFSNLVKLNWPQLLKNSLFISLLLVFCLTFTPFQVINLVSGLLIVSWFYVNSYLMKGQKKAVLKLIIFLGSIFVCIIPGAIYMKISIQSIDYFKTASLWEMTQQNYPKFWDFIAVAGPILIFLPFGLRSFFKASTPLKFLFFFYAFFSYVYFYSPLALFFGSHNGRFLSPIGYVLFGVLSILGMKTVTSLLTKESILLKIMAIILIGYFLIVTSVIYRSLPNVDELSYLPRNLITGIKILNQYSDKKVVLTSPMLPLGMIVPVIVDRKVYLGRSFTTPNFENKTVIVYQFYEGIMTNEQAKQFVMKNNIGYIILSSLEMNKYGNFKARTLEAYSFLKKIYENNAVKIYQVL